MWPILGVRAPKGASDNSLYNLFFGTISFHQKTSETCKNGFLMHRYPNVYFEFPRCIEIPQKLPFGSRDSNTFWWVCPSGSGSHGKCEKKTCDAIPKSTIRVLVCVVHPPTLAFAFWNFAGRTAAVLFSKSPKPNSFSFIQLFGSGFGIWLPSHAPLE